VTASVPASTQGHPAGRPAASLGRLRLTDHGEPGRLRLALHGELDCSSVPVLQSALDHLAVDTRELILDLTGLTFIDSSGVRVIVACRLAPHPTACSLRLLDPGSQVHDVFARLGLLDRLTVVEAHPA
jgi:anti-sigma B factor antagonist